MGESGGNYTKKGLQYNQAIAHIKFCVFKQCLCPNGCGEVLDPEKKESHMLVCENVRTTCKECGGNYYLNR